MAPFTIVTYINIVVCQVVNPKSCFIILPPVRKPKNSKPHSLWRPILLAVLILITEGHGIATTLVAVRGPDYVVLASDSRIGLIYTQKMNRVAGCKIQQFGTFFIGISGIATDPRGFNAYDLVRKVSVQAGSLAAIADRFSSAALEPFKVSVRKLREEHPADFAKYCNNRDCLQVAFARIEDGVPELSMRCFHVKIRAGDIVVEPADNNDCPGNCEAGWAIALCGMHDNADALLRQTPNFWEIKGVFEGANELIETEIKANSEDVGPPVSILLIDKTGPRWAPGHQGVCTDINK